MSRARIGLWQRSCAAVRSILLLHLNDRPAMGTLADLLVLVVCLDLEAKLATVDLQQLGSHLDLLALGRGGEVLDVDLETDRRLPRGQMRLHGLDARAFHEPNHRWCRQHTFATHVLDHQLVVDNGLDLSRQPRGELPRHGALPPLLLSWRGKQSFAVPSTSLPQ